MLRTNIPNQIPAPAVRIPFLGSEKGSGSVTATAEPRLGSRGTVESSASPACSPHHGAGTPAAGAHRMPITFARMAVSPGGTPSPSPLARKAKAGLAPSSPPKLQTELHVFECDREPEAVAGDDATAMTPPSLSLRRASAPGSLINRSSTREGARSDSPEPLAPAPQEHGQQPQRQPNASPRCSESRVPQVVCSDDGNSKDIGVSVDTIASARACSRSLDEDFVPDHLLNNEDFIDRLVSEVRASCRSPAVERDDGGANPHDSFGEDAAAALELGSFFDPEVLDCLHRGKKPAPRHPLPPQPQLQARGRTSRSRSPARSRSPSPCVEAVVLSAPATGTCLSPKHTAVLQTVSSPQQRSLQQQLHQRPPPCASGPTRPMRLAPPGAKAAVAPRMVVHECGAGGEAAGQCPPSPIPFASASRESSPEPRLPEAAVEQRPRPWARSVSPQQHPSWAPRPVRQSRPAWGQRVPPPAQPASASRKQCGSAREASSSPSPLSREHSVSWRSNRSQQRSPSPSTTASRRAESRSNVAMANDVPRDTTAPDSTAVTTATSTATAIASTVAAGEATLAMATVAPASTVTAATAAATGASTEPRHAGASSTTSSASPQPPYARVLFGEPGLSPLSQTDGGSPDGVSTAGHPETRSPILCDLMETVQLAMARAAKAEARCTKLEHELQKCMAEQQEERAVFATRLAQLTGQVASAVRWMQNHDPQALTERNSPSSVASSTSQPAVPEEQMETRSHSTARDVHECSGSDGDDPIPAPRKRSYDDEADAFSMPLGTPGMQGATPTPAKGASGGSSSSVNGKTGGDSSDGASSKGRPTGSSLRLPPSPPMVLHLQS